MHRGGPGGSKNRAAQTLYGEEAGGAIVPVEEEDFSPSWRAKCCATLDDLQSLFADAMSVSNSPMGCPTEINPLLIPVKTWLDWALEHQVAAGRRAGGKR